MYYQIGDTLLLAIVTNLNYGHVQVVFALLFIELMMVTSVLCVQ
jgi:hypothetical protein